MRAGLTLVARQFALVGGAILAYFGVRGITEGDLALAQRHAAEVLDVEGVFGLDLERGVQSLILHHDTIVTLANWIYIWLHWPVIAATLVWLLLRHRDDYTELRNAIFISGAIGLVIFAVYPVAPPRLFSPDYIDTVTQHSHSYRVLQPPGLVNKYAAVPSLHFGWNLLVGLTWARLAAGRRIWTPAAVAMPLAMGWAVVATANHWVLDVILGGTIALIGLGLERLRRRITTRPGRAAVEVDAPVADDPDADAGDPVAGARGAVRAERSPRWEPG